MKLWVDDIRNAPDESWTVARTITTALRALTLFDFEEISLDHDISHQVTVGGLSRPYPCDETYMAVAYFLILKYGGKIGYPKITIHSSNVVAGQTMKKLFDEAHILTYLAPTGMANRLEMEV